MRTRTGRVSWRQQRTPAGHCRGALEPGPEPPNAQGACHLYRGARAVSAELIRLSSFSSLIPLSSFHPFPVCPVARPLIRLIGLVSSPSQLLRPALSAGLPPKEVVCAPPLPRIPPSPQPPLLSSPPPPDWSQVGGTPSAPVCPAG